MQTKPFLPSTRFETLGESRAWLFLLFSSALGFLFVSLTSEMLEGEAREFDETILLSLRQTADPSAPVGPAWLTKIMTDLTALGGTTVLTLVTLLVILFLVLRRSYRTAIFVTGSIAGGALLSTMLKLQVGRPRPQLVPHLVDVYDLSFPSGHAMLSAITYLTLGALLSRLEQRRALKIFFPIAALLLTLLIGTSRVFLGVHYPTDVIGGWMAGIAWASLSWFLSHYILRPREIEKIHTR
jgi:undecaprenyl-diphosphatase